MKLYKTPNGIAAEQNNQYYFLQEEWESFVNDDALYAKLEKIIKAYKPASADIINELLPPIGDHQELWACGVTYLRSKLGRQEESKLSGGADFYGKVYEAERPEIFFKSVPQRVTGHNGHVKIRKDSTWDVPEPELTLLTSSSGKIIGYTIGNDMSSRSIEGENPLYLPQAKMYDASAAIGPCLLVIATSIDPNTTISMEITRNNKTEFSGSVSLSQMKRTLKELVTYVYKACSFPYGCLIMTGTGIVPGNEFTLKQGDEIIISIDGIGTLRNVVKKD